MRTAVYTKGIKRLIADNRLNDVLKVFEKSSALSKVVEEEIVLLNYRYNVLQSNGNGDIQDISIPLLILRRIIPVIEEHHPNQINYSPHQDYLEVYFHHN